MEYTNFQIENFKGIKNLTLDLNNYPKSNVVTLVGLNESGKTTILEAMHWHYEPKPYDDVSLIPKSELINFNQHISVTATLKLSNNDKEEIAEFLRKKHKFHLHEPIRDEINITRKYTYSDSKRESHYYNLFINLSGKTKRAKTVRKLEISDEKYIAVKNIIIERLLPPIIYYENFLFNFPDKLYLAPNEDGKLSRDAIFYKKVLQDVMNSMDKFLDIDKHVVERYKSNHESAMRALRSTLDKMASKITTEVFTVWGELLKYPAKGLSIILGHTLEEDEDGYYLQVHVKEGDQPYLIRERSLGFRWFFSFILFTYFRAYRDRFRRNALFLLDEPASNLHQTAQAKLLSAFDEFPNNQKVIYTTHSHHMINPDWLETTYVVMNEAKTYDDIDISYNSLMTNILVENYYKFVAKHPDDKDYYRPVLDALDYQPSKLEMVPDLIITEGKNDYYSLSYTNNVLKIKSGFERNIYPGTGKDKQIMWLVYIWLGGENL